MHIAQSHSILSAESNGAKCPKRILIVDDEADHRRFLESFFLSAGHEVDIACDGLEALAKLRQSTDLVLLDVKMPGLDGFEVARRLREGAQFFDVPILMVTALRSKKDRLRAVEAGINDFISKPVDIVELKVRAGSLLEMKEAQDAIKRHQLELEAKVVERTASLSQALHDVFKAQQKTTEAYLETIHRLVLAAEYKDKNTGDHVRRVAEYCGFIAQGLGLPTSEVIRIRHASPMHDIGKIVVPDSILLKPGKLSPDEWAIMMQHTTAGGDILSHSASGLLQTGEVIARFHHEKWDGSGYPNGLKRENIPLPARICAVADVFDALTNERPYKKKFSTDQACEILRKGRCKQFDPRVLDAFFKRFYGIVKIKNKYGKSQRNLVQQAYTTLR